MRTGVIAKKLGMTRFFDEAGAHVPVTVLIARRLPGRRPAHQGAGRLRRPAARRRRQEGQEHQPGRRAATSPRRWSSPSTYVAEFRVDEDGLIDVGAEITADHFVAGQKVDVQGVTIGKGFAGAMKRWNFGGLRATHGVSVSHRSHGSTGQRQDPGKVFKGKKMAGHLGQETRHHPEPRPSVRVDVERGLIMVKGAVPGAEGTLVKIRDAVKRRAPADAPKPGRLPHERRRRPKRRRPPPRRRPKSRRRSRRSPNEGREA